MGDPPGNIQPAFLAVASDLLTHLSLPSRAYHQTTTAIICDKEMPQWLLGKKSETQ
jgi:hypothetical protein